MKTQVKYCGEFSLISNYVYNLLLQVGYKWPQVTFYVTVARKSP